MLKIRVVINCRKNQIYKTATLKNDNFCLRCSLPWAAACSC